MSAKNTMRGTEPGGSACGMSQADLERGYCDATPRGNFEGSLDPSVVYVADGDEPFGYERLEAGTLHPGQIEPDGVNVHENGGFLRRPEGRSDIERY